MGYAKRRYSLHLLGVRDTVCVCCPALLIWIGWPVKNIADMEMADSDRALAFLHELNEREKTEMKTF